MRTYQISYPDEEGNHIVEALTEEAILRDYYPYWHSKMCEKYGPDVAGTYSKEDCLNDWIVSNWAVLI